MDKPKEIKLSCEVFNSLLTILENLDASSYNEELRNELEYVLAILQEKKRKLGVRDAYTSLLFTEDEAAKEAARLEYLRQKNLY